MLLLKELQSIQLILDYKHCAPNGRSTTRWERGRPVRITFAALTMT